MQKLISSLFILGAKATKQQLSGRMMQLNKWPAISGIHLLGNSTSSNQSTPSNLSTSAMVRPSSGEETLSISSDDGWLSEETMSLPNNVSLTQSQEQGSNSVNVSVPQQGMEPQSNSTDLSVQGQKKPESSSTDTSIPQCLNVAESVEVSSNSPLTPSEVMQLYQQSCSRMNMAAKMSVKLFDEETRMTHNVAGRNKSQLDTKIIDYIKTQCFNFLYVNQVRTWKRSGLNVLKQSTRCPED